jgi:hypothetical protein
MKEAPGSSEFLQEPHGVTTQKTPFFIVTAVKTSNLTTPVRFVEINSIKHKTERGAAEMEVAELVIYERHSLARGM